MNTGNIIISDPGIMGGAPCFCGTRIPLEIVLDHLKSGYSLQHAPEQWPTLPVADLKATMELAKTLLIQSATKTA
jgi:uncharacterized protein (DUF433 family)